MAFEYRGILSANFFFQTKDAMSARLKKRQSVVFAQEGKAGGKKAASSALEEDLLKKPSTSNLHASNSLVDGFGQMKSGMMEASR